MNIEKTLKKNGIEVIEQLDTLKVNSIARNVSIKLCEAFPQFDFDQNDLFIKLSRLNMYIAKMPEGMSEASYFYKNSSIYFNENIKNKNLEDFAIHECIHHIQEIKNDKNELLKMGLCNYSEFKVYGEGLNEAAVQLMTSKVLNYPKEFVKYFNISFDTTSPYYYPVECCLAEQLSYIVGEDVLFDSTINSNDKFKSKLVQSVGYGNFIKIENLIDKILKLEEKVIKINNKILQIDDRNTDVDSLIIKINNLKEKVAETFIKTQNLIISSYFDNEFSKIKNLDQIETYRKRLYSFKDYIGYVEGYNDFNDYYVNKMEALEQKYNEIESINKGSIYLIEKKPSKLSLILKFIKNLVLGSSFDYEDEKN